MGFFDRHENRAADSGQVMTVNTVESDLITSAVIGTDAATREMAMQIPTVAGCIDLISGIIAGTPIKLYRDNGGEAEEVQRDPRTRLLNDDTQNLMTGNDFWRAMIRDYYLGKGGFAYIKKNGLQVESLHYVDERQIAVQSNNDVIFRQVNVYVQGRQYFPHDFLRIARNSRDGVTGISIVEENPRLMELAYAELLLEWNYARNGGRKKGFLINKGSPMKGDPNDPKSPIAMLKAMFQRLYSDVRENFVVLQGDVSFQEAGSTLAEMQLSENKLTNAKEIARIFHVDVDAVGGKGTAKDLAGIARTAAIPLMKVIEASLNRDLLLEAEKESFYFAFDTKELLKGDIVERFNAYRTALEANFMQIDEVRYMEDLKPLGLTWIKLGLNDVLYDPNTKQVYTPNTNQTAEIGGEGGIPLLKDDGESGRIEERGKKNFIQGEDGKMNGSFPLDSEGISFSKRSRKLPAKEYKKVISEISSHYDALYKGADAGVAAISMGGETVRSGGYYCYYFEIHNHDSYGDFNIYKKVKLK